jgi:hypothetical protein
MVRTLLRHRIDRLATPSPERKEGPGRSRPRCPRARYTRQRLAHQPLLESLGERLVPTVFNANSLADVREPESLAMLPRAERERRRRLWEKVTLALERGPAALQPRVKQED